MKKIILILFVLCTSLLFSQEKTEQAKVEITTEKVEKLPEFPGGINAFRTMLMNKIKVDKFKIDRGIIKTTVVFKIEKDGTITDIKALGGNQLFNDEAIRAVSKIKLKWTPAELNHEIVAYRFRMPLTMSFE